MDEPFIIVSKTSPSGKIVNISLRYVQRTLLERKSKEMLKQETHSKVAKESRNSQMKIVGEKWIRRQKREIGRS